MAKREFRSVIGILDHFHQGPILEFGEIDLVFRQTTCGEITFGLFAGTGPGEGEGDGQLSG